ncbi:MAG: endonuclease/exonuclease/phosphatase family protein [Acidobacteriota bacterium]|nr:endonuclease/exonuclease/phosphatase family protein [Acidobacteriota bacterium]MDQ3419072.1 endonuclease/exonuclease/phosphatase family protein [Acidobacteriota bacterium]
MDRNRIKMFACGLFAAATLTILTAAPAAAQSEIVLHAKNASAVNGDWQWVGDVTAAGSARMWNPDRGAPKLGTALAYPYDYFELTFNAEAGRAYRLWVRGKADYNAWTNDSIHVQFSGSVNASGGASYRIGTTDSASVSLEACSGCGVSGWGWEDNGYGGQGTLVYFDTTGPQTLRIQRREDGVSIDQVVLSASTYLSSSPGANKNDTTILSELIESTTVTATVQSEPAPATSSGSATEIVIPVAAAASVRGNWQIVGDSTAAGGGRVWNPDGGAGKLSYPYANPSDYFEVSFNAEAGRAYRLWIRGQAESDYFGNDSVFVQFSGSVNDYGSYAYRIGSTDATIVSVEQGRGYGLGGWGWSDNGWDSMGPLVYFATTGPQTMRVQRREDGISIDQIVLSASNYLFSAPGAAKYDTTILSASGETTTSEPAPAPAPEPEPTSEPAPAPEPAPQPTGSGPRLRVMHWNVGHGRGTDGVYDIERQATWMARQDPDVVILNEVEKYTSWGNEDQPARFQSMLQSKTGRTWYKHFIQEYGQWSSNGKGHLILSTYRFDSTGYTTITQSSGLNGAGAAGQASITVNGRTVNLIVTHLDPYDRDMRLTQARDVINWASGHAENRILTGDMNAWPDQTSILEYNKWYNDSWTTATNDGTATGISGISPFGATKSGRIDYIFYSKYAPNLVVLDSKTPDTRDSSGNMPSDHRPVVTTFEVR